MKEQEGTSCLHTPVWGVEGVAHTSISKEMEVSQLTESTASRVFNGLNNDLNTSDNNSIDTINFEDFLKESTNITSDTSTIMDMIENADFDFDLPEPEASTIEHLTELVLPTTVEAPNTTENVWAFDTFDDNMMGLCLPAMEAEGAMIDLPVGASIELFVEEEEPKEEMAEFETNDLLKWIMDDQQIRDFSLPQEVTVTTPNFLQHQTKDDHKEKVVGETKKRVKMENLTEEEKYRRMREQNNRASQACRAKRKRKMEEEEAEVTKLEARNVELRNQLLIMEAEVAEYKKMVLEQVAQASRQ